jgi:hypothetical protein
LPVNIKRVSPNLLGNVTDEEGKFIPYVVLKNIIHPFSPENYKEQMKNKKAYSVGQHIIFEDLYKIESFEKKAIWPFGDMGSWVGRNIGKGLKQLGLGASSAPTQPPPPARISNEDIDHIIEYLENIRIAIEAIPIRTDGWSPPNPPSSTTTNPPPGVPYKDSLDNFKLSINKINDSINDTQAAFMALRSKAIDSGKYLDAHDKLENILRVLKRFLKSNIDDVKTYIRPGIASRIRGSPFEEEFYTGISVVSTVDKLDIKARSIINNMRAAAGINPASDGKFSRKRIKNKKSANYNVSDVLLSSKDQETMKKKADKFSNKYYRDASSGLDDEAAKSYFTGLKSMYGKKPKKTKADYKKLYELHDESGPDMIGSAHPKTIDIAEAMGNGGIFENQIEQQRHNIGVAQSMPSGNFQGKHAWVIHNLVKLAEKADRAGDLETSDLIDAALEELRKI